MSALRHFSVAGLVAGWLLLGGAGALQAQGTLPSPQTCPPVRDSQGNLVPDLRCAAGTPTAPASQRFPFPGESTPATTPPASNSPATSQDPADKRFPFPGDTDAPAPTQPAAPAGTQKGNVPGQPPLQDAGSSGQSSSSSNSNASSDSSSSSSQNGAGAGDGGDPDANDPAAIPRSKRKKLPPVPRQTPSEREQEDVQVAGFYFNDGNFKGSYDRAKDAVSLAGDDAAAQLALGNAARKLGKLDEAERAYKACLGLDPVPKVRKPAEKALHEMTGED